MKAMSNKVLKSLKYKVEEDLEEEEILIEASGNATINAVRESQALGLTIHVIQDNKIVAIHPDNSIEIIKELPEPIPVNTKLKKGVAYKIK